MRDSATDSTVPVNRKWTTRSRQETDCCSFNIEWSLDALRSLAPRYHAPATLGSLIAPLWGRQPAGTVGRSAHGSKQHATPPDCRPPARSARSATAAVRCDCRTSGTITITISRIQRSAAVIQDVNNMLSNSPAPTDHATARRRGGGRPPVVVGGGGGRAVRKRATTQHRPVPVGPVRH